MKNIDFYFDFISPYSYLAAIQLAEFSSQHGVEFTWQPVNLPKLIHESGNVGPATIKNKAMYSLRDLKRWASYLGVPLKMIRPGSFDSRPALRIAGALQGQERVVFCLAVFEALWSGDIDPRKDDWLEKVFSLKQLPSDWLEMTSELFENNLSKALKAGLFGVPTFIVHDEGKPEMFFGIDHMDFLARACQPSDRMER
ncbi:MAG: 2-hydroxychromene-2-carboxylate isomerase [Mariprofundaceae bacterium]|nr:2-hydroxychromene-2-carboxylate isomerase [Mariprofundaceae bacterium]